MALTTMVRQMTLRFSKSDGYITSTSNPKTFMASSLGFVHPHRPKSKTAVWRSVNRERPNFLLEDDVSRVSTRTSTAEVSDHTLGDSGDNGRVARTFRSAIELGNRSHEKSPSNYENFKNFHQDFVECFPEVKSDIMKHHKHEGICFNISNWGGTSSDMSDCSLLQK